MTQIKNIPCMLIGTHLDMEHQRQVSQETLLEKAEHFGVGCMEVSCTYNVNITKTFEIMAELALRYKYWLSKLQGVKMKRATKSPTNSSNKEKCSVM